MLPLEQKVSLGFIYDWKAIRPSVAFSTEEGRLLMCISKECSLLYLLIFLCNFSLVNVFPVLRLDLETVN